MVYSILQFAEYFFTDQKRVSSCYARKQFTITVVNIASKIFEEVFYEEREKSLFMAVVFAAVIGRDNKDAAIPKPTEEQLVIPKTELWSNRY